MSSVRLQDGCQANWSPKRSGHLERAHRQRQSDGKLLELVADIANIKCISQAQNLTDQVRSIAAVTKAVAEGDLTQKITVDAKGEILDLKITVNSMVDSLRMFSGEVTTLALQVGTEGRLGGSARVEK